MVAHTQHRGSGLGSTDDSRVWEVYDIKGDVVCISTDEPFYSEAEVWGNELSIVF